MCIHAVFRTTLTIWLLVIGASHAVLSPASERNLTRTTPPNEELKIAIVVGVDEYDYVSDLNYAQADAEALAELFISQGYIVETILGFEADSNRIINRIRQFKELFENESGEPEGSLVFTFSGHGFNNDKENFLATPDTNLDDLEGTAIAMSEITDALAEINVKKRVLFIDACRNNPTAPTRNAAERGGTFIDDASDAEGLAIMYSTARGSLSWEDPKLGKGVFTHFLLEGLKGAADDGYGQISFGSLHKYVASNVERHVFDVFRGIQKPFKGGEWSGDFILARHTTEPSVYQPDEIRGEQSPPITNGSEFASDNIREKEEFDFVLAAAKISTVRSLFCEELNQAQGQTLKKEANSIFFGKYKYKGKQNEKQGWQLYLDSMRNCNTAALLDISKTLAKRNRCDIAIEYAQLAADNGNRSASRLVAQLKKRIGSCAS